ncbi:MAG: PorV/PorQ family protein [candidate division KSB1 bacterium]|jgi:hypothetical protein|nr:PorV/PorQ family protein [candidate division KSB1 bacterium]
MKVKYIVPFLLFMLFIASSSEVHASGRRLGTAGAVELLIPMGARSVGMGGANIANVSGTEALYWNPAGLAVLPATEAAFSYMDYFADMSVSYVAIGSRIGNLGSLGFSLQAMNIGDIPVTTIQNPEGTGEMLSPNFLTLNVGFSRAFTDRINFGVNAKLISEIIGNMSARAVAFDFGLQYVSPFGVDFGVVMKNIGTSLRFNGTGVEFNSDIDFSNPNATTRKTILDMASHELPATFSMGLGYRYRIDENHGLNVAGIFTNNNYNLDQLVTGVEYSFNDMFFGRVGYNSPMNPDNVSAGDEDYQYGLTLGFGAHLPLGNRKVMFDYAYRDMDLFDANQYFSIGFTF